MVELLVGISTRLLAGARATRSHEAGADAALDSLIDFHLDFALSEAHSLKPANGRTSRAVQSRAVMRAMTVAALAAGAHTSRHLLRDLQNR